MKYEWLTAQKLATSNPQQLTATQPWKQPNGDIMANEQTIHTQLKQAHEKKLGSLNTERKLLHSTLDIGPDDALIASTADENGNVIQPGDGLMLLIYLSDRIGP